LLSFHCFAFFAFGFRRHAIIFAFAPLFFAFAATLSLF